MILRNFCGDIGPRIALSEEQFDSLLSTLKGLENLHLYIDLNEAAWLKLFTKLAPQLEGLVLSQDHMPLYLVQDERTSTNVHRIYSAKPKRPK
ncbi:hypothetical protein ACN42_g2021 [Penicillium freii]|uniref:Uncharacterized protein n=1 Tax=Penicillium freii TaxID=48697 RepID=A0A124GSP4_PENFR|nr:hypothetical protein ACN42_g2021 [Penicillium freii]